MKASKTFLLTLIICLIGIQVYGQFAYFRGGLNLSNMLSRNDEETFSEDFKMNPGFHVGTGLDYPLTDMVSVESGLFVNTKGYRIKKEDSGAKVNGKLNLYYLDLPVSVKGNFSLDENAKAFLAAGPYIGLGIIGRTRFTIEYQGETNTEKENVEWGDDGIKRLDYGLTVGTGMEVENIYFGVSYDYGLANLSSRSESGYKLKHRILKFTLGYSFDLSGMPGF